MRDAFGGIVNIAMIVVFITIVSGYLAFNVNYTKAFRVKNKIITTLEQYEGVCGQACSAQITNYMRSLGYSPVGFNINEEGWVCQNGYCIRRVDAATNCGSLVENSDKFYFEVVTLINIDIPIINKILPNLKIFQVSGNTKLIDAS